MEVDQDVMGEAPSIDKYPLRTKPKFCHVVAHWDPPMSAHMMNMQNMYVAAHLRNSFESLFLTLVMPENDVRSHHSSRPRAREYICYVTKTNLQLSLRPTRHDARVVRHATSHWCITSGTGGIIQLCTE